MAICLPKAYVCYEETSGSSGYKPNFVPGSTNCSLQIFDETRARNDIEDGDTEILFRSIEANKEANDIKVESNWVNVYWFDSTDIGLGETNTSPTSGDYQIMDVTLDIGTTGIFPINSYLTKYFETTLTPSSINSTLSRFVFDGDVTSNFSGVTSFFYYKDDTLSVNKKYTINSYDYDVTNSGKTTVFVNESITNTPVENGIVGINPNYGGQKYTEGSGWDSAIGTLRTIVNNNDSLITMPEDDVQVNYDHDDTSNTNTNSDPEFIGEFSIQLQGGNGVPEPPSALSQPVRTGPIFDMVFVGESEVQNDNGALDELNQVRYWRLNPDNTYDWDLLDNQQTNDCYDPDNLPSGFSCP